MIFSMNKDMGPKADHAQKSGRTRLPCVVEYSFRSGLLRLIPQRHILCTWSRSLVHVLSGLDIHEFAEQYSRIRTSKFVNIKYNLREYKNWREPCLVIGHMVPPNCFLCNIIRRGLESASLPLSVQASAVLGLDLILFLYHLMFPPPSSWPGIPAKPCRPGRRGRSMEVLTS